MWRMLGLLGWVASLYGVLQIHRATGLLGHAICGPWGCGPTVEALVSYHGFWFVLLLPPSFLLGKTILHHPLGRLRLRRWGLTLAAASLLSLLGIVIADAANWLSSAHATDYLIQRSFFRIATLVDVPLLPLICVGLIWIWQSRLGISASGMAGCRESALAGGANMGELGE